MRYGAIIGVLIAILIGTNFIFTVREDQLAIRFQFGRIDRADYEPGAHFKIPFYHSVVKFDKRILSLDTQPERFLTSEKKDVFVDSFVKWRIQDVARFYTGTGGDEVRANQRLSQIIKDGLRAEFARRTLKEAVSGARDNIMEALSASAIESIDNLGIAVVDVRIKRIDLPDEVSESVYSRMRAERLRVANELRSQGREAAERIRADADRRSQVILANAEREGQVLRGEGDAKAAATYASAYNANQEFYDFFRSLQAYRQALGGQGDMLVLDPESEFFKHFGTQAPR